MEKLVIENEQYLFDYITKFVCSPDRELFGDSAAPVLCVYITTDLFPTTTGNVVLAESSLPRGAQPHMENPPLRISQRMKLEPSQLEGVEKRIQVIDKISFSFSPSS